MIRGENEGTLCHLIQGTSAEVARGLNINPEGAKLRRVPFLGDDIEWSNEVKFLKIPLGSKLLRKSWSRAPIVCRRLGIINWRCTPKSLLLIYNIMVIPTVTYGWIGEMSNSGNRSYRGS